jgi:hypothetical protein
LFICFFTLSVEFKSKLSSIDNAFCTYEGSG